MKQIVETTGGFMLTDVHAGFDIPHDRPSVVPQNAFVMGAASRGQIRILRTEVPDEASDAEFAEYWAADQTIAIDAFMSKFSEAAEIDPIEPAKPAAPKTPRKKA